MSNNVTIIIEDKLHLNVEMRTTSAPCVTCKRLSPIKDEDNRSFCLRAKEATSLLTDDAPRISQKLLKLCADEGWFSSNGKERTPDRIEHSEKVDND